MAGGTPERIKVVLLGDSTVGKTSLLVRYIKGTFQDNRQRSTGANFLSRLMEFDSERVFINFWDTAGEERYRAIAHNYYRGAEGAILVYDITERKTFDSIQAWIIELKNLVEHVNIVIVGNKTDLHSQRKVTKQEGQKLAMQQDCGYYETSAKDNTNVTELFRGIASEIVKRIRSQSLLSRSYSHEDSDIIRPSNESSNENACCRC